MKAFSPLLTFNPELQRNLWLELTPGRLLGMPLVIALLVGGFYEIAGREHIFNVFSLILFVLLIVWGPWLSATSVVDEIMGRTWDVQRLSAQRAGNLVLGKFVGSTIYAWYGAAICLIGTIILAPDHVGKITDIGIDGLLSQSMAMFAAMIIARRGNGTVRRSSSILAVLAGVIFAGFFGTLIGINTGEITSSLSASEAISWFGIVVPTLIFWHGLEALMVAWIIFGAVRLMRRDIGYRDGPWGWLAFTLYTMIFMAGWRSPMKLVTDSNQIWQGRILLAAHMLTYVAVLGLPIAIAASRKFFVAAKNTDWRAAWTLTPSWLPAAGLTLIGALVYATTGSAHALSAIVLLGFLCRDIIVIYAFRIRFPRRSEAALMLYFIVIYLFASYATLIGYHPVTEDDTSLVAQAFSPFTKTNTAIGTIFPWAEALFFFLLFRKDLQRLYRVV
jgi:hypothetical protein